MAALRPDAEGHKKTAVPGGEARREQSPAQSAPRTGRPKPERRPPERGQLSAALADLQQTFTGAFDAALVWGMTG